MKHLIWLVALLACVAGCDKKQSPAGTNAKKFRVAMLLPGSDTDKGWNQMAREGLDRIAKELGAETKLVTNVQPSDFASQINYFTGEGFDVVICHGGEFEKEVQKAAAQSPKTHFIVGGCPTDIPNATAVEFMIRDASELAGIVAAKTTRTKKVAFVGAMEVPPLRACYEGFSAGVKAAGGGIEVLPAQWTDSWDSSPRAKEKAEAALNGGADVIYQNVDAAAQGVFEAVKEHNKPDHPAWAFGCNSNQNDQAPQVILGSVVLDVQRAYLDITRSVQSGTWKPGAQKLGLPGGYVDLVLNDKHPQVTPQIKTDVEAARTRLTSK